MIWRFLLLLTALSCSFCSRVNLRLFRLIDQFGEETTVITAGTKLELTCRPTRVQEAKVDVRLSKTAGEVGVIVAKRPARRQGSWKISVTITNVTQLGWYYCTDGWTLTPSRFNSILIPYVICSADDINCTSSGEANSLCFYSYKQSSAICGRQRFQQLRACGIHINSKDPFRYICTTEGHKLKPPRQYVQQLMSASLPLPLYYREVPSLCEYLLQDQPAYFQHSRPDSCEALDAAIIPQMILNSRSEPLPLGATLSLWSNSDPIEFRLQFFCGSGIKAALEDGKIIYEPADFHWCLLSATFAPVCSELPCGTDISLNSDDFEFGVSKLEAEYSGFRSYVFVRHIQAGTLSIRPEGWLIAKLLAIVALNITATCPFRWR